MSNTDGPTDPPSERGRPRADLAVEIVDGDVCIYDPTSTRCHVLSGGATLVWHELVAAGREGVEHRVAAQAGVEVDEIADDIATVLTELRQLDLLTSDDHSHDHADGHDAHGGHDTTGPLGD